MTLAEAGGHHHRHRSCLATAGTDAELAELISGLHAVSAEFTDRWHAAGPVLYRGARKTVDHLRVGSTTLDSDVLAAGVPTGTTTGGRRQ